MGIILKSEREISIMRHAGQIVAEVLNILKTRIKAGMKTGELDIIAEREIRKRGALPSFKGYRGYPASVCVSVNDEIVHGIPGSRVIREGDIVSLDAGTIYDGYQGDAAITVGIGAVTPAVLRLIETTEQALYAGIDAIRPGARLGDISAAVQGYAEARGYSVVREYTGHGIGQEMHEDPQIFNFGKAGTGPLLKRGMTLAIEPMLNEGSWQTRVAEDLWTVLTADGSLSAHFEHTVAVTDGHAEILTAV